MDRIGYQSEVVLLQRSGAIFQLFPDRGGHLVVRITIRSLVGLEVTLLAY